MNAKLRSLALFAILIALELLFATTLFSINVPTNQAAIVALVNFDRNPTPETRENWMRQRARLRREILFSRIIVGSALIFNTLALLYVWKRKRVVGMQGTPPAIS
jgi:hypothetical protein